MLLEFRVTNFRSIGEEQILSLTPAENQKEFSENILIEGNYKVLNLIALYGANGSGKSNLMKALSVFLLMVRNSAKSSSTNPLPHDPFLLREGWSEKPTTLEIAFILNDLRYRYGFSYNRNEITKEFLFRKNVGREVIVFQRQKDIIDTSSSLKANTRLVDAAIEATRDNGLFLSALDMLNIKEANEIFQFFTSIIDVDGTDTSFFSTLTSTWSYESIKESVRGQLKRLKLGLIDIETKIQDTDDPAGDKQYKVYAQHVFYDKAGNNSGKGIQWDFFERESSGSKKALELAAPLMVILKTGGILVIDEIEANMHPILTLDTINLFLNKDTNPNNAQLIFTTHDTNLLTYSNLRRDQIYFAEKNNWESTEIYSLSDFVYVEQSGNKIMKERPDSDKEKRYIEGRYGAIPVFGKILQDNVE